MPIREPRTFTASVLVATAAGAVIAFTGIGITLLAQSLGVSEGRAHQLDDILTGVIAGAVVLAYLRVVNARRRSARKRLSDIGEMNHHVRNALQVISSSHLAGDDAERLQMIRDSVNRIERALKDFNV